MGHDNVVVRATSSLVRMQSQGKDPGASIPKSRTLLTPLMEARLLRALHLAMHPGAHAHSRRSLKAI